MVLGIAVRAEERENRSLEARVNEALDRSVAHLLARQAEDGSWGADDAVHPLGRTALSVFALRHAGLARDHAAVERALAFLSLGPGFEPHSTYEAGCIALMLHTFGSTHRGRIHEVCRWLVERFDRGPRLWGYPDGTRDLSNTQFAVLALKVGELHGFDVPRDLWRDLVTGVLRLQARDGGFRYKPDVLPSASMTHAALLCLRFATESLGHSRPPADVRDAMERAQRWYADQYRVDRMPLGSGWTKSHYYYYLYGLERYAVFFGLKTIGGHDWYAEGAEELLTRQGRDGAWGRIEETCFAILFLRRVAFTEPESREVGPAEQPPATPEPSADAPPSGPPRPSADVPCLREWLVAGPYPSTRFEDDMLDDEPFRVARARPSDGGRGGRQRWRAWSSPDDTVDLVAAGGGGETVWCSYLAALYLHVEQDCEAVLWLGTDDGFRLNCNGTWVFESRHHDYSGDDAARIPLTLRAGRNLIVIQVANSGYYARLRARLTTPDGVAAPHIRATTRRERG